MKNEEDEKLFCEYSTLKCQVEYQGKMTWWDTCDNLVMVMRNVIIVITDNLLYRENNVNTGGKLQYGYAKVKLKMGKNDNWKEYRALGWEWVSTLRGGGFRAGVGRCGEQ